MALSKEFQRRLEKLFRRHSETIRQLAGLTKPGRAARLDRGKLRREEEKLVAIAKKLLMKKAGKKEFERAISGTRRWHPKMGKGWGRDAKKKSFKKWYKGKIVSKNCVYSFWNGKRCIYVGRTLKGKGRPAAHFEKWWFGPVTRINIHVVPRPRDVPMAECLAIDAYEPSQNRQASSKRKYTAKCPVCTGARDIRRETRRLFPLRA